MYSASITGFGFAPIGPIGPIGTTGPVTPLGAPVAASPNEAAAREAVGVMQVSLNRPPPQGVNAGIKPLTYKFDAQTRVALQKWLAAKGQPTGIGPGMWTRLVKAGLSEVGAKAWEGAMAFYGFGGAQAQQPQVKLALRPLLTQPLKVQAPTSSPLGPAPPPAVAASCSDGTLKFIDGEWKCLRIRTPVLPGAGTPATAPPPVTEPPPAQTFVTYPEPGSGVDPMTMMTSWPEAQETLTDKKKGLPLWAWILIGLGGVVVVGGGIYLGIRSARG